MELKGAALFRSKEPVTYKEEQVTYTYPHNFAVDRNGDKIIFKWNICRHAYWINDDGHLYYHAVMEKFNRPFFERTNQWNIPYTYQGVRELTTLPLIEANCEVLYQEEKQLEKMECMTIESLILFTEIEKISDYLWFSKRYLQPAQLSAVTEWQKIQAVLNQ